MAIALEEQLNHKRVFTDRSLLGIQACMEYNPYANETYFSSLNRLSSIIQSCIFHSTEIGLNRNVISRIHNHISHKEQSDTISLIPQVKFVTDNKEYLILVEYEFTIMSTIGLCRKYECNNTICEIHEITNMCACIQYV